MDAALEGERIIHRGDAETQSLSISKSAEGAEVTSGPRLSGLTEAIIGAAIEVHRNLGPGLFESAYEECLCYELSQRGLTFRRQLNLPAPYKDLKLDCVYRLDLVVEDSVIIEIKAVDQLLPIHSAQLLTYLKISRLQIGLLLNFNEPVLKRGIKRLVNHFREAAPKPVTSAPSVPEPLEDAALSTTTNSLRNSASPRLCGEHK